LSNQDSFESRLRLSAFVFIAAVAILIPLSILGQGFLPGDDALFYAAKVISGKTWDQIIFHAPGMQLEYLRFGWNKILEAVHWISGADQDFLVGFAVVFQFSLFVLLPCLIFSHAETWIAGLLLLSICIPHEMERFLIGRPMTFSITAFVMILLMLGKNNSQPTASTWTLCGTMVALGTYVHAPWYFFFLLPGFILARSWKKASLLFLTIMAGITVGALLTGHPVEFLGEFYRAYSRLAAHVSNPNFLVTELRPIPLNFQVFILVALALFLLKDCRIPLAGTLDNPIFLSFVFGAFAGMRTGRIWLDIGIPALAVWLAWQGELVLKATQGYAGFRKLLTTVIVGGALFLNLTPDFSERWTSRSREVFLSQENPFHKGWLPETGGILYSPNMGIFYDTFYSNPRADWKYILGFEGSQMRDEDYEIRREMLWNRERPEFAKTFLPWIRRMTKADRFAVKGLVLEGPFMELEWKYFGSSVSVGRKPLPKSVPKEPLNEVATDSLRR